MMEEEMRGIKKFIDSPSEIMFIFRMILFTKVLLSLLSFTQKKLHGIPFELNK
jgi:hypothetical protein